MESAVLIVAFAAGLVVRRFGYPPLLGYLFAGFAGGALSLGDGEQLSVLADAGVLLIPHWISGAATTNTVLVLLIQINTIAAAVCGLIWLAATSFGSRRVPETAVAQLPLSPLRCQVTVYGPFL